MCVACTKTQRPTDQRRSLNLGASGLLWRGILSIAHGESVAGDFGCSAGAAGSSALVADPSRGAVREPEP